MKKLNVSPQLFNTDRNYHYSRCKNSVGTSIERDLQSMETDLIPCRGVSGGSGISSGQPTRTPANKRRDYPPPDSKQISGDVWAITVINSADLARSEHAYRIPALGGRFTAQNLRSGGPELNGQVTGSVFKAVMTDRTGYRATFVGRISSPNFIEGAGCDNRDRCFSFTMERR